MVYLRNKVLSLEVRLLINSVELIIFKNGFVPGELLLRIFIQVYIGSSFIETLFLGQFYHLSCHTL